MLAICVVPRAALGFYADDSLRSGGVTASSRDAIHLPHARGTSHACEHAFAGEVAPPQAISSTIDVVSRLLTSPRMARVGAASPLEIEGGLNLYGFDGAPTDVVDPLGLATGGGNPHRTKKVRNISVNHPTRKRAREAAEHAHHGKPRPTPKKTDKKKREAYDEAQKYRSPEAHRDSEKHPESHFHDSNKSSQTAKKKINRHHVYPK